MRRRDFITLLGGTAAAWPLTARAQQPAMPVIGFFRSSRARGFEHFGAAFRRGLNEAGFIENQNVAIEYRWADGHRDQLPALANDLIGRQVVLIVANEPAAIVAKAASAEVPIVFVTGADPVRTGLVVRAQSPAL